MGGNMEMIPGTGQANSSVAGIGMAGNTIGGENHMYPISNF